MLKYTEHVQNAYYAPHSLRVEFQASAASVLIDADTVKHVELLSSFMGRSNSKRDSLMGVLNRCRTPSGVRQLRAGLFQPPTQEGIIERRRDAVEELIAKPGIFHVLKTLVRPILRNFGQLTNRQTGR